MESNLTDGLDFVESTVNGYIKPDAQVGSSSQDPLRVFFEKPDSPGPTVPLPEHMKKENVRMEGQKVKIYNAR